MPPILPLWWLALKELELELELIQTHMTQEPLLWVEVGTSQIVPNKLCSEFVFGFFAFFFFVTRPPPFPPPARHAGGRGFRR